MRRLRRREHRRRRVGSRFFIVVHELDKSYFQYIVECELMLWMRYHIDPYSMLSHISILDLEFYIKLLSARIENENRENNGKNKLVDQLVYLRDLLNSMNLPVN